MGYARACSVALVGVEGVVVEVQADLEPGVAAFTLVGLPDKSLIESRDRVRAAVVNSGAEWPQKKLTVGLSPASVPKSGSGFDLAVACAVLGAAERIDPSSIADVVMIGELGLDGRVRPVRGVLPAVLAAAEAGYQQVVVPEQTAGEAALVPGVSVLGVRSLRQLIAVLCDEPVPDEPADDRGRPDAMLAGLMIPGTGLGAGLAPASPRGEGHIPDLADVAGQLRPRKALEVAAAGGHHLLLSGPPGAGKTMLAERLPAVLPPLTRQESLEVTAVHSVAGILPPGEPLVSRAPYCAPHHSATMQSLVGGGNGIPRPGAVSLAHRGVLFLDEAPEFSGKALDALRQPLESGHVVVARAAGVVRLPARFLMVLAANPLPLRAAHPDRCGLRVPALGGPPLPGTALGSAARPGRPARRGGAGRPRGSAGAGGPGRADGGGRRAGAGGQSTGGGAADRDAVDDQQRSTRPRAADPAVRGARGVGRGGAGPGARDPHRPGPGPGAEGGLDGGGPEGRRPAGGL